VVRALPEHRYLSWNPTEYAAFRAAIEPGMIALDVGANVGAYSMLLAQWVGPSGTVYAFEPAPLPYDGLVRHIELNHVAGVVCPLRLAIGEKTGEGTFALSSTAGEGRLAGSPGADSLPEQSVTVQVETLDRFCEERSVTPDFIKIDVEGSELAALRGARDVIARRRQTLRLFVELHPSIWPTMSVTRSEFLAELDRQRLDLVPLNPSDDPWSCEGICVRLQPR
jgi:FkbM family methyltransferase